MLKYYYAKMTRSSIIKVHLAIEIRKKNVHVKSLQRRSNSVSCFSVKAKGNK
jgi:hypothetical protein